MRAVPSRGWVPRHCVHEVPDDSTITRLESGDYLVQHPEGEYIVEALREECGSRAAASSDSQALVTPYQGWNAYVQDLRSTSYSAFIGQWNVPAAPTNPDTSSVIFFFTGLQDSGSGDPTIDIIQPVLQYGDTSAAGGCLCWGIASWYVPSSGRSFVSKLITNIPVGSTVIGNMTRTGTTSWYINTVVGSQQTPLTVTQPTLADQPAAFVTEEAYAKTCGDYPPASSSLLFENLQLFIAGSQVTPNWRTVTASGEICNSAVTPSGSSVKFTW